MSQRERRLFTLVIAIAVIGAAFVGWNLYNNKKNELQTRHSELQDDWIRIEALLEKKELWQTRAGWLKRNLPTYETTGQIDTEVFRTAEEPGFSGIVTKPLAPLPTLKTKHYTQAGVSLVAEGKLEDVFRWLYELKKPEKFYVLRNVKVTPHEKNAEFVRCQFELLRWYAPKSESEMIQ